MALAVVRVLTLNIWFSEKLRFARTRALLRTIEELQPTVCCFQEVVPQVAQILLSSLPGWSSSDPGDGSTVQPYGVLTLVAPDVPVSFQFHQLPTNMFRQLLVAEMDGLSVATVHLESLANHPKRRAQLSQAADILRQYPNSVLVGDFNFDSERNFKPPHVPLENEAIGEVASDFVDLWLALRPGERGLTFDSVTNPYLGSFEQMRYDRVLTRLSSWCPQAIDRVGHDPGEADEAELSAKEMYELSRPPTPPRPSVKPREPRDPWGSELPEDGVQASRGSRETPRDHTPPPPRRRLFLSDHFGLVATLNRTGVAGDGACPNPAA